MSSWQSAIEASDVIGQDVGRITGDLERRVADEPRDEQCGRRVEDRPAEFHADDREDDCQ